MPVPINLPIGEGKEFCGITDLISLRNIEWASGNEDGKKFEAKLVKVSSELWAGRKEGSN